MAWQLDLIIWNNNNNFWIRSTQKRQPTEKERERDREKMRKEEKKKTK